MACSQISGVAATPDSWSSTAATPVLICRHFGAANMHPSQPERRVLVIGARLDLGAHARERHAMDPFEVVAIAPLNDVGAREVALKNSALPFQRRETPVRFPIL